MDDLIYSYTDEQALEDGTLVEITDEKYALDIYGKRILITSGVFHQRGIGFDRPSQDYLFFKGLTTKVKEAYDLLPEENNEGGNDRKFFVISFRGVEMFVAGNGLGGLTVTLPEEY